MNRQIPRIGAAIVCATVFLFAVCLIVDFSFGAFFVSCFVLPMTGLFRGMADGETSRGGATALVIWCAYFRPVGMLVWRHFGPDNHPKGD